jgi:hypothetical protein
MNTVCTGVLTGDNNRRRLLGDDSSLGPLPVLNVPSFGLDSNLVVAGLGAVALIWAFSNIGGKVRRYTRERSRRTQRKRALQAELRSL